MAVTIISNPPIYSPAYNPNMYVLYDVPYFASLPGFRYVYTLFKDTVQIGQFKVPPAPDGFGYFDTSKVLESNLINFIDLTNTGGTEAIDASLTYNIQFGEEYALAWEFNDFIFGGYWTQLTGSTANPYSIGDQITVRLNDQTITDDRAQLNGTFTVVDIPASNVVEIDLVYNFVVTTISAGNTFYADRRKFSDYNQANIDNQNTFNSAYPFVDWINYDANTVPMQGPTSIFLTDAPRTNFTIKPWQSLLWNVYDNGWNTEYMVIAENSNGETYKLPFSGATNGNGIIQLNVGPDAGWQTFTEYPYSGATLPMVKDDTEWYTIRVTDGHCLNECDEVQITLNFVTPLPSHTYTAYRTAQIYNGKSVYQFFIGAVRYAIFYNLDNTWSIKEDGVIYTLATLQVDCTCTKVDWTISGTSGTSTLFIINMNNPAGHIEYGFDVNTPTFVRSYKVTWTSGAWKVRDYSTGVQVALGSPATTCPSDSSFEPDEVSPFSLIRMYACEIECPTSEYSNVWHVNTTDYPFVETIETNIQQCYGEQQITEEFKINLDHSCQNNETQVLFLDRKGSWSSFAFPLKVQERMDNEKLGYRKQIGGLNQSNQWTYNTYDSENANYSSSVKKQYNLTTHWLNKEMDTYLQELISSPSTYVKLNDSDVWLSCNVLTKSVEPITKRLIQRTITIELSSNDNINI